MVREALESNFDPEQTAKNCVEALEFSRRSRVVDVVTDVIRPALIGSIFEAGENYNELHELARRRLGGAALATTLEGKLWPKAISKALNIRDRYRGVDARDINRPRLLDEGCPYTESDLLALYATTGAIVAAALWATNRTCFTASDSEKGDLDHKAIALESLRFGGLNTSLPPRTLEFGGKSVITCISPAMVLRDPSIVGADPFSFNEGRFGPSNDGTSSRVIAAAFGYGMHRCPSSTVIPPFLESLSAQLAGSGLAVSQSDPRYPARSDLNAFRPRAGHDSIVI